MDFWQHHGLLFLILIAMFPRFTMFFGGIVTGFGLLSWLGFIFAPHILVAILACHYYWDTNPLLCVIAWVVALGGTGGESKVASNATRR